MLESKKILLAAFAAIFTLSACQALTIKESHTLVDLNDSYVSLVKKKIEMERQIKVGDMGELNVEAARIGILNAFATNGDEATESANKVETNRSAAQTDTDRIRSLRTEASFVSVAVRSYLSSESVANYKIEATRRRGIETCQPLTSISYLPVTCGFFYLAGQIGAHGDTIRLIKPVVIRAENITDGSGLSSEEWQSLVQSFDAMIRELEELTKIGNSGNIKFSEADPEFRKYFFHQQDIFICNARKTLNYIIKGSRNKNQNESAEMDRAENILVVWTNKIKSREDASYELKDVCKNMDSLNL